MRKRNLLFFMFLIACCIRLAAQETAAQNTVRQKHTFSFRAGYGNMLKGTSGLTKQSHSYERDLSEGVVWDAQYDYHLIKGLGIGFLYSGFSSKGSHDEGSDRVYTHYAAPQLGIYCFENRHVFIRLDIGVGGMAYRNYSKVFGKSRKVKGSSIAANVGANATWKIARHWNLEADIQYVMSGLSKIYSYYHDERITVKFNKDRLSLSRLNLSAGVSYNF